MVKKIIKNFSIEQICDSGQCFRMKKLDDGRFEVIACHNYLLVSQNEDEVSFECSKDEYEKIWMPYFDIDGSTDYAKIIKSIDTSDLYLSNAAKYGSGIRILNQDLFEMIISFIISQRNNIKRIRTCIKRLCEKYGEEKSYICEDGSQICYYDFPKPDVLAKADISDIRALGVGYRDSYIVKAARDIAYGVFDLDYIKSLDYENAKKELLKIFGVGNKVADCICLFSLHHTDAFPMDTHIISIVEKEYNGCFPFEQYIGYAGVLQQYMFFYDLS